MAIGLFLVYSGQSEKAALETARIKQSLEQTHLNLATNLHDTSANICAPCLYDTNTDHPQADAPKQQLQSLQFAMQRDASNVTFTDNPDGSRTAFLNGTFRTVTAAKRQPDGTLRIHCFDNFEALRNFMNTPTTK